MNNKEIIKPVMWYIENSEYVRETGGYFGSDDQAKPETALQPEWSQSPPATH